MSSLCIKTTEMHTGGDPLRIVESGMPNIQGRTILDKCRYIRDNLDYIRKFLMYEPRGHFDMFGVVLVEPDIPEADLGCIFIHNEGYSTMCGHGIIALGRYAVDKGIVKNRTSPETKTVLQCPCGPVEVFVEFDNGNSGGVRFNSVPAFAVSLDIVTDVPEYGQVKADISYGGAFYAIVPASRFGLDLSKSSVQEQRKAASALTDILRKTLKLCHPDNDELAFLYGTILTDDNDEYSSSETDNICVYADQAVARSPCGSGITARVALQFARGLIQLDQQRTFSGPAGYKFKARAVEQVMCEARDAVIVEVSGKGHYIGSSTLTLEEDDEIGKGFLLR